MVLFVGQKLHFRKAVSPLSECKPGIPLLNCANTPAQQELNEMQAGIATEARDKLSLMGWRIEGSPGRYPGAI